MEFRLFSLPVVMYVLGPVLSCYGYAISWNINKQLENIARVRKKAIKSNEIHDMYFNGHQTQLICYSISCSVAHNDNEFIESKFVFLMGCVLSRQGFHILQA